MHLIQSEYEGKERFAVGKYHTFEREDGDLAVRRCAGEDSTQLVGGP
jgi:hypothetical protein